MLDANKMILGIIFLVVIIVVAMSFIGSSSKELTDAADSITDANNCSLGSDASGTFWYNITDKFCYNSTNVRANATSLYEARQFDLPLNSLYSRTGVVLLVMMAALLLVLIGVSLKFFKKAK